MDGLPWAGHGGQRDPAVKQGVAEATGWRTTATAMTAAPLLPLLPSGELPPAMAVLRWLGELRRDGVDAVVAGGLPDLNGSLPDLLALGGIGHLLLDGPPTPVLRWEGLGGARLTVTAVGHPLSESPPVHHGPLPLATAPTGCAGDQALLAQLDIARLEDAAAVHGLGDGAAWDAVLANLDRGRAPRPPVLRPRAGDGGTAAWNPLALAREVVVALPAGRRPWGVRDAAGRHHPAQVVEGAAGPELLVSLPLGPLECTILDPLDEPVPGCRWEVGERALDNGRLRVELDALGQVVRLCGDGIFADLAGPAVAPELGGLPLAGDAVIEVAEAGPVRARLLVIRRTAQGILRIGYTLHAHEAVLRVSATWEGDGQPDLAHPTSLRGAQLEAAGELAPQRWAQAASVFPRPAAAASGMRWALLDDGGGRGLALLAPRPFAGTAQAGVLRVRSDGPLAYALALADGARAAGPGRLALHLACPGRASSAERALPSPLRLAADPGLVPLWASRPQGWTGELLLADHGLRRGRALLQVGTAREAWRCDAAGGTLQRLPAAPDGDGFLIDHGAGAVLLVRWR